MKLKVTTVIEMEIGDDEEDYVEIIAATLISSGIDGMDKSKDRTVLSKKAEIETTITKKLSI